MNKKGKDIVNIIRELRIQKGLTNYELAEVTGISTAHIKAMENNNLALLFSYRIRIAIKLKCPEEQLIYYYLQEKEKIRRRIDKKLWIGRTPSYFELKAMKRKVDRDKSMKCYVESTPAKINSITPHIKEKVERRNMAFYINFTILKNIYKSIECERMESETFAEYIEPLTYILERIEIYSKFLCDIVLDF